MNLYGLVFLSLLRLRFCTEFVVDKFSITTSSIVVEIIVAKSTKLKPKYIILYSSVHHFEPPSLMMHALN